MIFPKIYSDEIPKMGIIYYLRGGTVLRAGDIGTNIALLYRYSQSYFNEELKKYGLGNGQYAFLLHLLHHEGINQETLAHEVKIDKTTAARAVAKLVAAGYVKRTISDSDRRAYVLTTTKKTQDLQKELKKTMIAWQNIAMKDFTATQCCQMADFLAHAVENVIAQERP